MFPRNEIADRKKTLRDLQEIEELNINEERIVELESEIANLRNLEVISGGNEILNIETASTEREKHVTKLKTNNTLPRNKLGNIGQGDVIIDLTQHPEENGGRKDRFATQYQDIGGSGIEINDDGRARREAIALKKSYMVISWEVQS